MRLIFLRICMTGLCVWLLAAAASSAAASPQAPGVSPTPPAGAAATTPEMDLGAYRAELERIGAAVARLHDHPEEVIPLRRSLPKAWAVRDGDQRFEVPTAPFDSVLAKLETPGTSPPSAQKELEQRVAALRQQAEALAASNSEQPPRDARAHLENILRRSEFRAVRAPGWWDELRERIGEWLIRFLGRFFRAVGGIAQTKPEIFVWTMIALAFIVLALWLRRRLLRAARAEHLDLKDALPPGKTWSDWAQEALSAAARGDYRAAVHAAYWAGVYRLEELGVWQLDRARTPREYLRLLARDAAKPDTARSRPEPAAAAPQSSQAERAAALAALTRNLESTWYGNQPATAGEFHAAVAQLEALGCRFPSSLQTANS